MEIVFFGYWFIALMVKIYYFQFSSGLNVKPVEETLNKYMLIASLATLLIIFSVCLFLFYKRRKFSLFLFNVILSVIMLADVIYFRYYQTPINVALIYQVGYVGDVAASIQSLFRTKDLIYILDLPFYFIFYYVGKRLPSYKRKRTICWIISLVSLVIGIFTFKDVYNQSNTILYNYDRNYAARDLGVLYYHYYDMKHFIVEEVSKRTPLSKEESQLVENFFIEKEKSKKTKHRGIAEGRNLIMVQVEALQSFVMENTIDGEEITPFLNGLIEESLYFPNIYHQVAGGNTSDAEFMTNNSLYPATTGAVYFRYPYNKYLSLPYTLSNEGYTTYAAHAFRPSFWNRQTMYNTLGFNHFFSGDDFELNEQIGWAVSDESFYRQTLDKIDTNHPFYAFMVTLSSHHPYDAFRNMDNIQVGSYEGTQLGDYIKAARYDDYSLETLFKELKDRGLYDNSIIVIYGDHSAIYEDQKEDLTRYLDMEYNPFNWQKMQKIPFILHVPGEDLQGRVDTVGGQMDILPTLANLMGLDMTYTIGKDLLNTDENSGYAVLRDSSIMTKDYMYLSLTGQLYDMHSGEVISMDKYGEEIKALQNQLIISDTLLGKDYFKKMQE